MFKIIREILISFQAARVDYLDFKRAEYSSHTDIIQDHE